MADGVRQILVFVGQENLIFGEALPELGGRDGITSETLEPVK